MVTAKLLGMLRARCVRACPIYLRDIFAAFGGAAATRSFREKRGSGIFHPLFPSAEWGVTRLQKGQSRSFIKMANLPHGGDRSKVGLPTLDLPLEVR